MENFEEYLCSEIKHYNDIIIYGFRDIAVCMLDYIIEFDTSIKLADYSGRVKYFAWSGRERKSNRKEIKGIKICSIYDLTEYSEQSLVIIATKEIYHEDIGLVLDELGFNNRIFLKHENYCVIRKAVENHKAIIDSNLQQYHLNHQLKLNRIREKVSRGKRIKVFFMSHDSAVFGCSSIYHSMMADSLFDPYIYVVSRRDVGYIDFMAEVNKDLEFFIAHGYRVISGYDEWNNPKDLHSLRPDIIFYDLPKMHGEGGACYNRLDQLNWEYLTCYVPYGLLMVDSFYYHYHTKCIRETWKFFLDTSADFKRVLADGGFSGFNTVLGGYPKFDEYVLDNQIIPEKLNNGKPLVIYAPHHSLFVTNNFATFDLYKDMMLQFAKDNPHINFVFKPHPLLPFSIEARYREKKIDFTKDEYDAYIKEWDGLENGMVITQGDYIKLFKICKCLITDCGSFIGEYFPSQNACIYLFNPRKKKQEEVYTPLAKSILETYYIAKTEEELKHYMHQTILLGNDEKRVLRKKLLEAEFWNIGHSGEYITNYIRDEILS